MLPDGVSHHQTDGDHHSSLDLEYDQSVAEFAVPKQSYLQTYIDADFTLIATSTLVLGTGDDGEARVLLLQRASSDEDPDKWEPPGGACDDTDMTVLHAAAREVHEEAGLHIARIDGVIGKPYHFALDDGRRVARFHFVARVNSTSGLQSTVVLNPVEHQRFLWATEIEVQAKQAGGMTLGFTNDVIQDVLLEGLQLYGTR
jgi:8-oxo-dGTP pyrophosphatase MutT (NUDIX family)